MGKISFFTLKLHVKKFYYLMCPPLTSNCRNIEINTTKNRHFALAYSLGKTRLLFIGSMEQEPSIYFSYHDTSLHHHFKVCRARH